MKIARTEALISAEQMIAFVLRNGVLLSGAIISMGLGLRLLTSDSATLVQELTLGHELKSALIPNSIQDWTLGLLQFNPDVIISLGLCILIALPVLRVAMTIILFMIERDWIYLGITLFVFSVLMFSILFGKAI